MSTNFENLDVWKRSARLTTEIYKSLKECNDYGFKDQITRSALSVPSNIAEGYERVSNKETVQFLSYAKGSCGELRTQLYIGVEIGYIEKSTGAEWIQETKELSKMISGLIMSISKKGN